MATIFYAVGGEGMGHATRSEAVINHLLLQGHKIVIFSYERAFDYLKKSFHNQKGILGFVRITGINFVYEKNKFRLGKTILKESKKTPSLLIRNASLFFNKIKQYNPNIIITDFEPISNIVAKFLGVPLICIDNINFLAKCKIDKKLAYLPNNFFVEYALNFNGNYNFITTVFKAKVKEKYKKNTILIGPILRNCIYNAKPTINDFILVYQTSNSNTKMFDILKQSNEKYVIYGFNKKLTDGNLIFKKPSKNGFAKDLSSCKAIITNGGFTLISEAVYLKKPIYSIPVKHQVEQQINGHYIEKMKYGISSKEINIEDLTFFLKHLNLYKRKLSKVDFDDPFILIDEKVNELINIYTEYARLRVIRRIKEDYVYFINRILKHMIKYLLSFNPKKINFIHKIKKKPQRELSIIEKNFNFERNKRISYSTSEFGLNPKYNILFLHGLGGKKSVFIDMIENLNAVSKVGFKVLLIDLMGHGKSSNVKSLKKYSLLFQSRMIKKIIDKEFGKKAKVNVVGHCFGSFISIKLAVLLKKRISYLFLISSNPFLDKHIRVKLMANPFIQKVMKTLFKKARLVNNNKDYDYNKFINSSDYNLKRIFTDLKNTSLKGYIASLYWMSNNNTKQDFKILLKRKANIIMVHGKRDMVFFFDEIKNKTENLDLKLVSLPNANHLPVFNSSRKLAKIIDNEIKKI